MAARTVEPGIDPADMGLAGIATVVAGDTGLAKTAGTGLVVAAGIVPGEAGIVLVVGIGPDPARSVAALADIGQTADIAAGIAVAHPARKQMALRQRNKERCRKLLQ